MRSHLPKVLHPLAGRPLLSHVIGAAQQLRPDGVHVVYGHGGERVRTALAHEQVGWVEQSEQLGTGHAVAQAMPGIEHDAVVLILYGDVPLVPGEQLGALAYEAGSGALALLTVELEQPRGYGRVVRDGAGNVRRIVEEKDASAEEKTIGEVNTGILACPARHLHRWLGELSNDNAQGEYYLTDIVLLAAQQGIPVKAHIAAHPDDVLGVNDRLQLAHLERVVQARAADTLMRSGTTFADPARFDLRGKVESGRDVFIDVGVVIEGDVILGDGVHVGPNVVLRDCVVEEGAVIEAMSVVEQAQIGPGCQVGPFARIRPGTRLARGAKVGNFVEIKKSDIGAGSKVNHLSYVGDTTMGAEVNIGAGTITCNYDGANKHRTIIGDGAFIGSDSQLVAPVEIGAGATVGAGSTVTRDAPAGELTLSRAKQRSISGWQRPIKKPKA
jgi:bifunctional UDP-N-acetylglucosamine pyrophosphorylase/glucosamine-1-phosphate N-acetyltransferase